MLKKFLLGFSIVCGACTLFLLDGLISQPTRSNEKNQKAEKKDLYNEYGLPIGEELSDTLIFSNDKVVCYTDRIFNRFQTGENSVENTVQMCVNISNQIQAIDQFVILPIPSRIIYENGYEGDKAEYDRFVTELKSDIAKDWTLLDVRDCFDDHANENLYYRTGDSITLLGGLYAANELVDSLGGETLSRGKFQTFQYNSKYGSLYLGWLNSNELIDTQRDQMSEMVPDPVYSYAINGCDFDEVLYKTETDSYERPAILMSSVVGGEAIGNSYLRAVIDGEGRSFPDSIAFLVGDSVAGKIAPYLAYYYDTVCVIAISGEDNVQNTVNKLRANYDTAHLIWAQDAAKMGDPAYNKALHQFMGE